MLAEQLNILPKGASDALEGVPNIEYFVLGAIGLWLLLEKSGTIVDFFTTTKQEELEEMIIETKILEEKLKQQELNNKLGVKK